jgi:hypothetical protein
LLGVWRSHGVTRCWNGAETGEILETNWDTTFFMVTFWKLGKKQWTFWKKTMDILDNKILIGKKTMEILETWKEVKFSLINLGNKLDTVMFIPDKRCRHGTARWGLKTNFILRGNDEDDC